MPELMNKVVRLPGRLRLGLLIVGLLAAASLAILLFSGADPISQDQRAFLSAPSAEHWLGTDRLGRDILVRLLHAGRLSLTVSVAAVAAMVAIGLPIGVTAGYVGGAVDTVISRLIDILLAFPFVLGAVALMAVVGPGLWNIFLVMALLGWPQIARVVRAGVIDEAGKDYVAAVRVAGGTPWYVMRRHILPGTAAPVAVFAVMGIGTAILTEATLSFLGFGVQAPQPSWGMMISEAQVVFASAPWVLIAPGAAIVLACLGFNLIGEGLRDAWELNE